MSPGSPAGREAGGTTSGQGTTNGQGGSPVERAASGHDAASRPGRSPRDVTQNRGFLR